MFQTQRASVSLTLLLSIFAGVSISPQAGALEGAALTAWQEDVSELLKLFPEREKGLTPEVRAEFTKRIEALQSRLPELDEQHVAVEIMQAVALVGNAHTAARPQAGNALYASVPIRLFWFSDGVYVVKTRPEFAKLLSCRLVSIGGHNVEELMSGLSTSFYGNTSWRRCIGAIRMTSPGLLYGLDLITSPDSFEIVVEAPSGATLRETLTAEPAIAPENAEEWWDLAPAKQRKDMNWVFALDATKTPTPFYLKEPNKVFWSEYIAAAKALYVQYNSSVAQEGATGRECLEQVLEALKANDVRRVVVDLRFNTGGNLMLMRGVFGRILREEIFQRPGSLYVITGISTFSAGLFHAANLKQEGRAIVVGELVGDDLDFWAEWSGFALPNSKMRIAAQHGFHSYTKIERPDLAEHLYLDLSLDTLEPDVPAPMTFADYIAGRDPSLEAALSPAISK